MNRQSRLLGLSFRWRDFTYLAKAGPPVRKNGDRQKRHHEEGAEHDPKIGGRADHRPALMMKGTAAMTITRIAKSKELSMNRSIGYGL
jgi:hypothetical protein